MQGTTRQTSADSAAEPRSLKARLFGDDQSDHLHKQVIKARLLRQLQQPTGGVDTREEGDSATEPAAKTLPPEPVRIGRYAVLRKLGHGGMGVVYVAYDEDLDRKVAIKLLRSELSKDERGRTRMLREAQALARLSHPNVVQVHEVGQWRDHDYVAMEFIDGQTLARWLGERPRPWREVLDVMAQAGRGLEAAHAAELVHRDLKPANLMVGRDGRARVLDFGLARASRERDTIPPCEDLPFDEVVATAEHDSSGNSAFDKLLTVTGAVLGTPAYMAPEQHLGEPATALSDQFSFCVVLFEALYGERPFKGKSRTEYAVRVAEGDIQIPAGATGVPVWLRKIVCRGLAKRPEDRWPSMTALLAELGRDRTRTWGRVAIAAGVLAAIVGALALEGDEPELCAVNGSSVADTWGDEQREAVRGAFAETGMSEADAVLELTERSLDEYAQGLVEARGQACEARWVERSQTDAQLELRNGCLEQRERELAAVVGVLADADREVVRRAPELVAGLGEIDLCSRVELLEAGTPAPKDAEALEKIVAVRGMIAEANAARDVGRMDEAKALTAASWRIAEQLEFDPLQGEVHNLMGRNARLERDLDSARSHLTQAVAIAQQNQHHELAAAAWLNLAHIASLSGVSPDESLEFILAAAAVEQLGSPARYQALLEFARGLALRAAGQPRKAILAFDRVVGLAEAEFVGSNHLLARVLAARSEALASLGRTQEARADLEEIVAASEGQSRAKLDALFDLAVLEMQGGDLGRGERDMKAAMEGYRSLLGPSFEAIGHGSLALGNIAINRGDVEAAEEAFGQALLILDEEHADHDWVLDGLASAQVARKDYEGAEQSLRKALAHREKTNPDDLVRIAYLHGRLAGALRNAEHLEDAVKEFERAIELFESPGVDAPLDLAVVLLGRGEARLSQGKARLALDSLRRAVELAHVDCGEAWLVGETRATLAEALYQLDIDRDERVALARTAVEVLREVPGSKAELAHAQKLLESSDSR